jgi:hypothetical protein
VGLGYIICQVLELASDAGEEGCRHVWRCGKQTRLHTPVLVQPRDKRVRNSGYLPYLRPDSHIALGLVSSCLDCIRSSQYEQSASHP